MGKSHSTPLRRHQWSARHHLPPVDAPRRTPPKTYPVDDDGEMTVTEGHPPDPETLPPSLLSDSEPPAAPTLPPTSGGHQPPPLELDPPDPFGEFRPNPANPTTEEELRLLEQDFLYARPYGEEPTFQQLCDKFEQSHERPTETAPVAETNPFVETASVAEKSTDSDDRELSPDDVVFEPVQRLPASWRDQTKPKTKQERLAVQARRKQIRIDLLEIDQYLHAPTTLATKLDAVAKYQSGLPALVEMLNQTVTAIAELDASYQKLRIDPPKTDETVAEINRLITDATGIYETMSEQSTQEEYAKLIDEVNGSNNHIHWLTKASELYQDVREYYAQRRILRSKELNSELIVYEKRITEVEEAFLGSSLPTTINLGKTQLLQKKNPRVLAHRLYNLIHHFNRLKVRISDAIRLRNEEETGDLFYAKA